MDKNLNERFTTEWAPRLVPHAATFPEPEPDNFEDVGPELIRLYDPIPPDIAEINEIAERLRAKTLGSASVLSIEVGEDGSLTILASGSEGYINLIVDPGECAHLLGWSVEEIKHCIKYSLVWID